MMWVCFSKCDTQSYVPSAVSIGSLGDVSIGSLGDVSIGSLGDVSIGSLGDVSIGSLGDDMMFFSFSIT